MEVRAGKFQITPQGHFPNQLKKQGQELKNKWGIVDSGEVTNGSSSGAGKKSFLRPRSVAMGPFRFLIQMTVSFHCQMGEEKWAFGNCKRDQPFHFKMVITDRLPCSNTTCQYLQKYYQCKNHYLVECSNPFTSMIPGAMSSYTCTLQG